MGIKQDYTNLNNKITGNGRYRKVKQTKGSKAT